MLDYIPILNPLLNGFWRVDGEAMEAPADFRRRDLRLMQRTVSMCAVEISVREAWTDAHWTPNNVQPEGREDSRRGVLEERPSRSVLQACPISVLAWSC